jgi:two-component system NtrC family response regulator
VGKILVVDDEKKMCTLISMALNSIGYQVEEVDSAENAQKIIETFIPDVMITDIRMEGISGIELLKIVKSIYPKTEVIVMTAYSDVRTGIEAMKNGAFEYISKPFEMDELILLVKNALEKHNLSVEVDQLRKTINPQYSLDSILCCSKNMKKTLHQAKIVAKRDTTILIRGRSGTGKELIARGIHTESGRTTFTPINCAAIPENLLESELFGHEKGAFTGANVQKIGLFERAGDGTIFLDEIGDISQSLQVKLLRVLQEREYMRVGGSGVLKTKARIIAATNRNLEEAVESHSFREDLYYRLNVFPISVPSLSERVEDIPGLVDQFFKKYNHVAGIDSEAMACITNYSWPGNVRELENCIERSVIFADNKTIVFSHLPDTLTSDSPPNKKVFFSIPDEGISLDEVEKSIIIQALEKAKGNKTDAAKLLGISRRAIYSKMKTHYISG